MREGIEELVKNINIKNNPTLIADEISHFLINLLKSNKINLYEAYLVNMEAIRFRRMGYIQSSWNERVRISTLLTMLNQKLLANVFDDSINFAYIEDIALEAYKLNKEIRAHYIFDRYTMFLEANTNTLLLQEMLDVRHRYKILSDNDGPYHNEVFPYHFYSPEEILLNDEENRKFLNSKSISEYAEELIVQLSIL